MSIIVSAASRKDGITFNGSKYSVMMNEKKDGTVEYKHVKIKKAVQVADKKIKSIFLLRGVYEFFKNKLIAIAWILFIVIKFIPVLAIKFGENSEATTSDDSTILLITSVICATLSLLFVCFMIWRIFGNLKKVWMYHGAEHKVIHALDNELELTLENVRAQRRYDRYCGSMLACFIALLTIISFIFIPNSLLFYPLIFAISWEIFGIKDAENVPVIKWFYKFGMVVQEKILTKEPTDEMIFASIEAVKLLVELESQE